MSGLICSLKSKDFASGSISLSRYRKGLKGQNPRRENGLQRPEMPILAWRRTRSNEPLFREFQTPLTEDSKTRRVLRILDDPKPVMRFL
ncbi:hypothetical protein N7499_009832 [Penicillium canescens]|uniref:Uncharacterized protein n=1 Tax=Penicillium canescens TaxID=5083 RepID=A0AAD6IQ23_PENCN|nr:uncharacterized protein N7446_008154 [Penicillium canescens]KAJ6019014.1 hypothetical protein N7522_001081 [Penicillium canescens]KAJ6033557.1 hypothetical protein N7444_011328 [Penicillium canescens]KAJ6057254.1 hypothetical protein N7460_000528 [Penicillium canescens]KAJ6058571.1 hypothetical protein N7446_008154 [Penicillium canescens]KAJ6071818.1 hypothetical protein N7499_009832 [Penicillium canescens]